MRGMWKRDRVVANDRSASREATSDRAQWMGSCNDVRTPAPTPAPPFALESKAVVW